jgi:hypothetical protein
MDHRWLNDMKPRKSLESLEARRELPFRALLPTHPLRPFRRGSSIAVPKTPEAKSTAEKCVEPFSSMETGWGHRPGPRATCLQRSFYLVEAKEVHAAAHVHKAERARRPPSRSSYPVYVPGVRTADNYVPYVTSHEALGTLGECVTGPL